MSAEINHSLSLSSLAKIALENLLTKLCFQTHLNFKKQEKFHIQVIVYVEEEENNCGIVNFCVRTNSSRVIESATPFDWKIDSWLPKTVLGLHKNVVNLNGYVKCYFFHTHCVKYKIDNGKEEKITEGNVQRSFNREEKRNAMLFIHLWFSKALDSLKVEIAELSSLCEKWSLFNSFLSIAFSFQIPFIKELSSPIVLSYDFNNLDCETIQSLFKSQKVHQVVKKRNTSQSVRCFVVVNPGLLFKCFRVKLKDGTKENEKVVQFCLCKNGCPTQNSKIEEIVKLIRWSDFGISIEGESSRIISINSRYMQGFSMKCRTDLNALVILLHFNSRRDEEFSEEQENLFIVSAITSAFKEMKSNHPDIFLSEKESKREELIARYVPEVAESICSIVKRSVNLDFQQNVLTTLDVSTLEEAQSKLVALMKDILGKKVLESSGKRRNEDDTLQNSKVLRNE